jgi:hypothetical protein
VIVFLVGRAARDTLTSFFRTWGARLQPKVQLVYYDELAHAGAVPAAHTYVFTDLERRLPQRPQLARLADRLLASGGSPAVLNHPRHVLGRFELLTALHERGVNPFRILPADTREPLRFPVFVRDPDEHHGPLTPLVTSRAELDRELDRLRGEGVDLASLAVVEFEDTRRPDGLFRKYVTTLIGDEVVHGNLCFSEHWVVKYGGAVTPEQLAEQEAEWFSTEHVGALREIADLAGVRYGRFDYTVHEGRLRIWELNTNPTLLQSIEHYTEEVRERRQPLAERITDALDRLDSRAGAVVDRPPVPIRERRAPRFLGPLARRS